MYASFSFRFSYQNSKIITCATSWTALSPQMRLYSGVLTFSWPSPDPDSSSILEGQTLTFGSFFQSSINYDELLRPSFVPVLMKHMLIRIKKNRLSGTISDKKIQLKALYWEALLQMSKLNCKNDKLPIGSKLSMETKTPWSFSPESLDGDEENFGRHLFLLFP